MLWIYIRVWEFSYFSGFRLRGENGREKPLWENNKVLEESFYLLLPIEGWNIQKYLFRFSNGCFHAIDEEIYNQCKQLLSGQKPTWKAFLIGRIILWKYDSYSELTLKKKTPVPLPLLFLIFVRGANCVIISLTFARTRMSEFHSWLIFILWGVTFSTSHNKKQDGWIPRMTDIYFTRIKLHNLTIILCRITCGTREEESFCFLFSFLDPKMVQIHVDSEEAC